MTDDSVFEKATERLAERDRVRADALLEGSATLFEAVNAYERKLIVEALRLADGKLRKAARLLGVCHQTLAYIIDERHGLYDLRHKPKRRRSLIK